MGKFNYLLKGSEKVKIGDDEFTIKPLTARHLGIFLGDTDNQQETMMRIILTSLQQTDETITREDIEELPLNIFQEVSEVVLKVNDLK